MRSRLTNHYSVSYDESVLGIKRNPHYEELADETNGISRKFGDNTDLNYSSLYKQIAGCQTFQTKKIY